MTKQIEAIILALNRTLGSFCEQLQCSVEALRQSVLHRPIPPDSASSSFIKRLNHRLQMSSFLDEKSVIMGGPNTRSYLLLLVRMNKLVVETINGMVAYRAL